MLPETEMLPWPQVTLARGTIHNPEEPRHFMKLKPLKKGVRISMGDHTLAISQNAIRLIEIGGDFYDPPIYVPEEDVLVDMAPSEKHTICPLKGEARYFSLPDSVDIAWSYPEAYEFAAGLRGFVAFCADRVTIEETPL